MLKFFKTFALPLLIGALLAIIFVQNFPQFFQGESKQEKLLALSQKPVALSEQTKVNAAQAPMLNSYNNAVKKAAPAVVNIYTAKEVKQNLNPFFQDPFFRDFFGNQSPFTRKRLETSLGSGVILTKDGLVVTNEHLIRGAKEIKVALQDGREVFAEFIGADQQTDIAVLKLDLQDLPILNLADSEKVLIGDQVLAIGNPFGIGQTVTQGIISALGRTGFGNHAFEEFIQTDAAINPGNSGGALVNVKGELVGINTMIYSKSGGYQGIGFAIPSLLVKKVTQDLVTKGQVVRGWIGAEVKALNPQLIQALALKVSEGLLIDGVWRNSPAQKAGILPGDLLIKIDAKSIKTPESFYQTIDATDINSYVELTLIRNSNLKKIKVKVMQKPKNLRE